MAHIHDPANESLTEAEQLRRALVSEKHEQARNLLRERDLDCWLTFTREGSDIMLPFVMGGDYIVGTSALMVFADGPSVAIVADYDVSQVEGIFDQVIPYSLDWKEPFRTVLTERDPATIGVNYSEDDHGVDGLTHGFYLKLIGVLEPLNLAGRLVSAESVAATIRAVKSTAEVERMRRAAAITQRIFDDLTSMLKPGISESDVFDIIVERMQTYTVEPAWAPAWCPSVASVKSDGGHTAAGTARIERGETLRVDLGVIHEGYASDMQRTWYFLREGETDAPDDIQHAFETVRDGIQMAADLIKPGVTGRDVDKPVRGFIEERGYGFTHALGHQIGRLAHDGGMLLGPDNARYGALSAGTIEAGMVFTLEPCVATIALEEDVLVTESGCEFLSTPQRELYLVS